MAKSSKVNSANNSRTNSEEKHKEDVPRLPRNFTNSDSKGGNMVWRKKS